MQVKFHKLRPVIVPLVCLAFGIIVGCGFFYFYSQGQPTKQSCGNDRKCFYEAFRSCQEHDYKGYLDKNFYNSFFTIEGDPVIYSATISFDNANGCIVEITHDSTRDDYAGAKLSSYICSGVRWPDAGHRDSELVATDCIDRADKQKMTHITI